MESAAMAEHGWVIPSQNRPDLDFAVDAHSAPVPKVDDSSRRSPGNLEGCSLTWKEVPEIDPGNPETAVLPPKGVEARTALSAPPSMTVSDAASAVARICAIHRRRGGRPLKEAIALVKGRGPRESLAILASLSPGWRDHAITCVYAVLMPSERRKRLGAYFTPPHLVEHLMTRLESLGVSFETECFRDPAAGGAAFVVPLARRMVRLWLAEGLAQAAITARLRERLQGTEIDRDLAILARALLARALRNEYGFSPRLAALAARVIRQADGLSPPNVVVDHEAGNPPYRRLSAAENSIFRARFPDIASGRMNLYAMFTRNGLNAVSPGGLVGHVVPASIIGGPEFATFRARVSQLAEVLVLDVVEKRTDVFLDAVQDCCFIVLRRRAAPAERKGFHRAISGVLTSAGDLVERGVVDLAIDGAPWALPSESSVAIGATLTELGWRPRVGHLVANRNAHRLHKRSARGRFPLIWAAAITSNGIFDFDRGRLSRQGAQLGYVDAPDDAPYVVREECIAVQRTSALSQGRRLTAAVVPTEFVSHHGGIVGENHVILLVRARADAVPAATVAELLNSPSASEAYARVGGSVSISARVLADLALPALTKLHR
jgi:adenine-specific DNA-methyltransferase